MTQHDARMDTMMTVSDAEYEALVEELVAKQKRRNHIVAEIQDLQDEISEIENARRNLPTKPGMYWHPEEKWPAFLDGSGRWSDGWGNDLEEMGSNHMDLEHVKRVEFVDD